MQNNTAKTANQSSPRLRTTILRNGMEFRSLEGVGRLVASTMASAMMIVCGHPLLIIGDGAKLALLSQCDWNFETRELARA